MNWKELLEYLKNNIEFVQGVNDTSYDSINLQTKIRTVEFNINDNIDDFYCLYIFNTSIHINHKSSFSHILVFDITQKEFAEALVLWEEVKETYSDYHIGKINQFMKTKKNGPKSIEELDDNGNND